MKNDLTCAVARDLLPSYVEGLTSEETAEAVERHVQSCPDCAARLEAMRPLPEAAEAAEAAKEVDYLRRMKKGVFRKITLAVVCTALVIAGGFLVKEFVIGQTPDPEMIDIELAQVDEENNLTLLLDTYWGAYELRGLRGSTEDGVLTYTARQVRMNIFEVLFMRETDGGMTGYRKQIPLRIPLEGLTEVWICGRLVYQDGVPISAGAYTLYQARTPYVGDAPALGGVARAVGLDSQRWNYTTELQTSERPYRWTIRFQDHWGDTSADMWMRHYYGPWMLALVDNLDEVGWTYTTATSGGKTFCQGVLTLEEADARLAELLEKSELDQRWKELKSVKDFAATPAGMQVLYELLWEDLLWEDRGIVLGPGSWIETVPPDSSPAGAGSLEQE